MGGAVDLLRLTVVNTPVSLCPLDQEYPSRASSQATYARLLVVPCVHTHVDIFFFFLNDFPCDRDSCTLWIPTT